MLSRQNPWAITLGLRLVQTSTLLLMPSANRRRGSTELACGLCNPVCSAHVTTPVWFLEHACIVHGMPGFDSHPGPTRISFQHITLFIGATLRNLAPIWVVLVIKPFFFQSIGTTILSTMPTHFLQQDILNVTASKFHSMFTLMARFSVLYSSHIHQSCTRLSDKKLFSHYNPPTWAVESGKLSFRSHTCLHINLLH